MSNTNTIRVIGIDGGILLRPFCAVFACRRISWLTWADAAAIETFACVDAL
jgi:hypothetical protein